MDMAKLFMNGRSQAVRLPKAYRFRGDRVYVKKLGKGVLLMPEEESWDTLIQGISQFTEDYMSERDQGTQENREGL
jgi:antitoxin VapB